MKIISIESPQQLKDRTVKASITVAEEDYIPLILLANKAYKGEEIKIDYSKEKETTPAHEILINIQEMLKTAIHEISKLTNEEGILQPGTIEQADIFAFPETIKEGA